MSLFQQYDRWVHNRVMNPVFAWIQQTFHRNRFDLIRWSLVSYLLPALFLGVHVRPTHFIALWITLRLWKPLGEMSERYEKRTATRPPEIVVRWMKRIKDVRMLWNFWFSSIVVVLSVISFILFLQGRGGLPWNLAFDGFGAFFALCFTHLWDVDDIDPKDRVFLFGPQSQES